MGLRRFLLTNLPTRGMSSYCGLVAVRRSVVVAKVSAGARTQSHIRCTARCTGLLAPAATIMAPGHIHTAHFSCSNCLYTDGKKVSGLDEDFHPGETEEDAVDVPFLREICTIPDAGHHVMVIQPAVKWGPRKKSLTTPELQLAETCALVTTLPRWKVVQQRVVPVKHPDSAQVFGSGTFRQLKLEVGECPGISAVVMGTDLLSRAQLAHLQRAWRVPVFDRYSIVLQIFKAHASTSEAKLQVALAEIPYVRGRLSEVLGSQDQLTGGASLAGGTGDTHTARARLILQEKEVKVKKALQKVKAQRALLRQRRQRTCLPTVAVVGYTNAGKTSVIKALTGDVAMEPRDQLFATLDVTAHRGKLPNNMAAVFMDTVGFVSDIPTALIDAFAATLEDAMLADVVVHVRDVSHPDTAAQKANVLQTLSRMLSHQQLSTIIEVCNKADRNVEGAAVDRDPGAVVTSTVTGRGLPQLREAIQDALLSASGQLEKKFRIPMQGPMLAWLYKEATVRSAEPCPKDCEHLIVDVIISNASYQRFRKMFSQHKAAAS
ncbi:hypothetical protein ACOMHN_019471 [Nucella lapillus]